MQSTTTLCAAFLSALLVPAAVSGDTCSSSGTHARMGGDIVTTAVEAGSFRTLAAALEAADLVDALRGEGPFTVFAPTDEAFAKLPKGTLEMLLEPENKALLANVLTYHVVPGKVTAEHVVGMSSADALNGQRLAIHVEDGAVTISGAGVVKTDVMASNGVIHVIDRVLMPATKDIVATASEAGSFRTLLAAAKAAGLAETLSKGGPFTVLAPNDEAFAKLPEGTLQSLLKPENRDELAAILKLHVIEGRAFAAQVVELDELQPLSGGHLAVRATSDGVTIGGARVLATDVQATNGVLHVIDQVLLPRESR